jgi:cellulose synthase operon protein C
MPATSAKSLSPAELAKLEHAFATDPSSEAYKPLAEAYLGMGRFMEAMVVCKKGVKAHPTHADPRVLLSRVYAEQGKDKKALEELVAALQVAPNDKTILRMAGALQMKTGDNETGKQNLLKAFSLDPSDADTQGALKEWKVEAAKPAGATVVAPPSAAPAPPGHSAPNPQGPPVLAPGMAVQTPQRGMGVPSRPPAEPAAAGFGAPPRVLPNEPITLDKPRRPTNGSQPAAVEQPARPAAPRRRVAAYHDDHEEVHHGTHARSGGGKRTIVFAVLAMLAIGGYAVVTRYQARAKKDVNKFLALTARELKHDSYDSYQKATVQAEAAVNADASNPMAHAYLAYIWAIRSGEHGGGPDAEKQARDHLAEATESKEPQQYAIAADALLKSYAGKTSDAANELESQVKKLEADGTRPTLLHLTLGLLLMSAGDMERAKDYLDKAQAMVQDDARIYSALGMLYRRKGDNGQASRNFEFALKFEPNHQDSMLGRALLILEQENPNYETASKLIKKVKESQPPPSPRQLAMAHMARALLISKVTRNIPDYKPEDQKKILDGSGVPADRAAALAEASKEAKDGFIIQHPELFVINGKRLLEEGQVDQAITQFKSGIEMDRNRAQSYVELARAYLLKPGGEKEAQDTLNSAIKTMGPSPRLMTVLGQTYLRQGKTDEALAQFQAAVADQKTRNPDARQALGRIYLEKKDFAKASEVLEKAITELFGQSAKLAEVNTDLGRAYEGKGDRTKADEAYQKALNADPDYSPAYFFYARFLNGDPKTAPKAKLTAQEYLKREPRGPYAAEAQTLSQ